MNNFNEDLRLKVISDLGTLEKDVNDKNSKTVDSQVTYNLSGGKELSIQEAVNSDKTKVASSQVIVGQAANSSSISKSIQSSVALQTGSMTTTVTDSAQAAADIKSAANAMTKLSADIGGISNTLRAVDDTSEMTTQAMIVNDMFLKLSNDMEGASLDAIKMAADLAGAIKEKVASSATSADTAVTNLLTGVTTDFDTRSAQLTSDEADLASAKSDKNITYGDFNDNKAYYNSSRKSYNFTDKELNYDLRAEYFMPKPDGNKFQQPGNNLRFNQVQFEVDSGLIPVDGFVEKYCVFLVKTSEIDGFTLGQAQKMFTNVSDPKKLDNKPGILVDPANKYVDPKGITTNSYLVKTSSNADGQVTYELKHTDGKETAIVLYDGFNKAVDLKEDYRLVVLTKVIPALTQDYGVEAESLTAWSLPFNYKRPIQIPHVMIVKEDTVTANYNPYFPNTKPEIDVRLILLPRLSALDTLIVPGTKLLEDTKVLFGKLEGINKSYEDYASKMKGLKSVYDKKPIWKSITDGWKVLDAAAANSSQSSLNAVNNTGNLQKQINKNKQVDYGPIQDNNFTSYPNDLSPISDVIIKRFKHLDKFISDNQDHKLEDKLLAEFNEKCDALKAEFEKADNVFDAEILEVTQKDNYIMSVAFPVRIDEQFGDMYLFNETGILYDDYVANTISDLTYLPMGATSAANNTFEATIDDSSKDFFGNYVIKGTQYIATVLIVATGDENYNSSLAWQKSAIVTYKTTKPEEKINGGDNDNTNEK